MSIEQRERKEEKIKLDFLFKYVNLVFLKMGCHCICGQYHFYSKGISSVWEANKSHS